MFVDAGEVIKVFIDDIWMVDVHVDLKQIESRSRAVSGTKDLSSHLM